MSIVGTDPESRWGLLADPGDRLGRVDSLAIITQRFEPGRGTALHAHDVDEALTILEGLAEVRIGDDRQEVGAGVISFVPAGVPHAITSVGDGPLAIHAAFPATSVEIRTLDPDAPANVVSRARLDLRSGELVPF
jgi:quercetin dioxygenase-like cupin family protein